MKRRLKFFKAPSQSLGKRLVTIYLLSVRLFVCPSDCRHGTARLLLDENFVKSEKSRHIP